MLRPKFRTPDPVSDIISLGRFTTSWVLWTAHLRCNELVAVAGTAAARLGGRLAQDGVLHAVVGARVVGDYDVDFAAGHRVIQTRALALDGLPTAFARRPFCHLQRREVVPSNK